MWFNWAPPQFGTGYVPIYKDPWINIQQFFFPALVLALGEAAVLMRLTRSSMLEVLRNDYIRTAWSKGLRERAVVWRHALKNAIIPIVTVIGLQIGGLLGGAVIIESLYNLNGTGKYVLEAIIRRDIFVVQSMTLLVRGYLCGCESHSRPDLRLARSAHSLRLSRRNSSIRFCSSSRAIRNASISGSRAPRCRTGPRCSSGGDCPSPGNIGHSSRALSQTVIT